MMPEEVKKFDVSNPSQSVSPTALPQGRARRASQEMENEFKKCSNFRSLKVKVDFESIL